MSAPVKKILFKTFKITGITVVSLIALLFALPYLFPQTVSNKIKQYANQSINGKIAFSGTRLSFFKRFPTLTLTLYDVSLKGSAPFENDTLLAAKELSFGINLSSVFDKKLTIDKIYLTQASVNILSDSAGHVNYNVYKGKPAGKSAAADTASASLGIDQILVENSKLVYDDKSIPVKFVARGLNYNGKGDFSKNIFDLYTKTDIQSVDFYYDNVPYLLSKKVNADLITKINTKSLAFVFQKNDLLINKLPVKFVGKFGFIKDGYEMDFKINSNKSNLHDIVTALPPEYLKWLDKTEVNGTGDVQLRLAGNYIAKDSIMPDLSLNVKVRNGYINNQKSPAPISNLYLNFDTSLPGLDPDSLTVNMDSLYFNINKDHLSAVVKVKGAKTPDIYAKVNTEIDLEKWDKALGAKQPVELKGKYALNLLVKGKYATAVKKVGIRGKKDTVVTSIPQFSLRSSLTNGYVKYANLPEALKNISFNINANCPDNNYNHASFEISNLNINALDNYVKGNFRTLTSPGYPMTAGLQAKFDMADIKKFYPIDSISLSGLITADLQTKGKYLPKKNIFPSTKAVIKLQNGLIQTKYYPHPIQNIQVNTVITNSSASLNGLKVNINPVSFNFEDKPFYLRANLKNFNNIEYDIASKGTLDIGKIYRVFAVKDYDVKGQIQASLSLKGKQSDALAKNYDKLSNSGSLKMKNIKLTSELFPKPFFIKDGTFSFNQDKMNFDAFKATYGKSVIYLNGSLTNVIDYATRPGAVLKGDLNFGSSSIIADDFMAFADASPDKSGVKPGAASGVILVPANLNLNLSADVRKVRYNGMDIKDVKGKVAITKGSIVMQQTGFTIVDAPVTMDATYSSLSPQKAVFDYHINAKEFDIKKAYDNIKLFHDMASSAKGAEGLVSLDYKLAGRLNSNMRPVYPSLKGGGVLSVKKVKIKGFKLFGAVGNKTDHKGIDSGDVSKVDIKTTIANNIITIERTKMRMAGFRLRFEGQVSFDNALNLQFRLGLPPFGIFGIPMHITGTQDKPVIHLGNAKKEDELKETDDADTN
ncbi:MAG TPA: AsmA-like C-terminal region-containing protein [Mucilaginibacter sp.]